MLAGGQGKRLGGRDKALILLGGRPLAAHVLDSLGPQVPQIAISANGDLSRFAAFGLPVLPDHHPDKGPLAGVHAGLIWAKTLGALAVITVSVDCPFLPDDLVARLTQASGPGLSHPAMAHAMGCYHPTIALWPLGLLAAVSEFLTADTPPRLAQFLHDHGARFAEFADASGFDNINTPEDLARAEMRRP